jgi:hypothetical protein
MSKKQVVFSCDTLKSKDILMIKRSVSKDDFVQWMRGNYETLRCYHSARPVDVSSYYKVGFVPTDMPTSIANFKRLLDSIGFVEPYDIQRVIDQFSGDSDQYIYFCLDKEGFLKYCSQYMIYGSELLLCFAQHVSPIIKYELQKVGLPTIFHCNVALSNFKDDELIGLYDKICSARGSHREKLNQIFSHYSVIVEGQVPADSIVHHEHPTVVLWDAHSSCYYKNEVSSCDYCSAKLRLL